VSEARRGTASALVALVRPRHWIKNAFVLAPLLFSGTFLHPGAVSNALLATLLFCVASSVAYIINDLGDIERDRTHRVKRHTRPLASGEIGMRLAIGLMIALTAVLLAGALVLPGVVAVIAGYLALNVAYTFVLKSQPVLDIFSVASGLVFRVYAGAVALPVVLSSWMLVTTLCLGLYLAALKRRQELSHHGHESRTVLEAYSVGLLDRFAQSAETAALVFYSLFVLTTRPSLVVTIPLVLYGLFRYQYVVDALGQGESPTDALLQDVPLLVAIALWVATAAWGLWPS
jgi:decaprenyl-phosphate phosphoribosyltransferase